MTENHGPRCWDYLWYDQVVRFGRMATCSRREVGAVLVKNRRLVAAGFNGNLPGHKHCSDGGCERCSNPFVAPGAGLERCVCCHAEQNIVSYCAREGVSMNETTLYLPATPCLDCFKLVASSGVKEIVYETPYPGSEELVRRMAQDSGIIIRNYACSCGVD